VANEPTVIIRPVANWSARPPGCRILGVVIHCTTGGPDWDAALNATLSWFNNATAMASAHIVIARNGDIYESVPDERNAWHAGIVDKPPPAWLPDGNPNNWTLGVELVGDTTTPYTDEQYASLVWWIRGKMQRHGFPSTNICAHSDLYRQRGDPGGLFSWDKLRDGLND